MRFTKGILFATALTLFFFQAFSQNWKVKQILLQSRWAKDVDPNHTLEAYPRPQMKRKAWTNLNGLWDYAITVQTSILPSNFDGKILVPYPLESALSGVQKGLKPEQNLWYRRIINRPKLKTGEKVLLHFGAVDWQATVFVNGKEAGNHTGGYTAFSFDITPFLNRENNEIVVKVYDPTDKGIGPHGKQVLNPANIYYTPSSGIWQTVWLETVPAVHISGLTSTPDVDQGVLKVVTNMAGTDENYSVRITAFSEGKKISSVNGKAGAQVSLEIPHAHLWFPDDPFLYDLSVELLKGNKVVDKVQSYFGMRKVAIQKDEKGFNRIFLNNKYVYNLGVLDQGFWPDGLYSAPTDEAMEFDIKAIKEMGFNTIRKHIKIEPVRWYYYADKLGMMVWQDMVNPNQSLPAGAKDEFEKEAKEALDQLHNYPSITTWVLFNERWGAYDQERLTKWMKDYDPSRIVNGHSGELLYVNDKLRSPSKQPYINSDLTDVHSYPDPRNPLQLPSKSMVLGEFGGVGVPVPGHQWDDLQGWGYVQVTPDQLERRYREMTNQLKTLEVQGLSGSIYTQPFDVEGEENGLMTYDREIIKIPMARLREINGTIIKSNDAVAKSVAVKDIDLHDTDERYAEFLKDFDNGKRDSVFLRRLILISLRQKDTVRTKELSSAYINSRNSLYTLENLRFISVITQKSTDPGLVLFKNNAEKVNAIFGPNAAARKIKDIIQREEIDPFLKNNMIPHWDEIQNKVKSKYGDFGEAYIIGRRLFYYWTVSKEWDKFGEYYVLYYKSQLKNNEFHINNISWDVFEHVSDKDVLAFAAEVMKYDIEQFDSTDPYAFDTYANILYKLGRKEEALKLERSALELADDKKVYLEAISKMEKGIPTWKTDN
ncbi:glycoside hydrolase family 2 protein [Mucilaginibacter segetis]|uniref:Glycoside hydrolase family 2 n=1 Tax=Mucilaginibacter segetis TaxID=2793071 RepID=A0A934UMW4_9SPHI|nr:sugar-binding domain-containing protein [Mucilaginibacter segetis]MBK0379312.1 glycoside hydrolase family 2 [Mucilaginibacter segetis]